MPTRSVLRLDREQVLAFRRRVAALDERHPPGDRSIEAAAFAGLQDSMPRAAQLSLAARVAAVGPAAWQQPPLVQVWGPRFSAYVIAARDVAVFTLGRHPDGAAQRRRAEALAERLREHLGDEWRPYDDVGAEFGIKPNALRYATTTGTVLLRWEGARRPLIRSVPAPELAVAEARLELARRYLHVFAPGTAAGFSDWAGIRPALATGALEALASSLTPVRTVIGDAWILSADEAELRRPAGEVPTATARLLPSGDTLSLLQGRDRELLVPDPAHRAKLWTPRVWPGAVLAGGEVRGTWRRAREVVSVEMWGRPAAAEREAIEAEAAAMPLPGLESTPIRVRWEP